jgi:hypothetical protein
MALVKNHGFVHQNCNIFRTIFFAFSPALGRMTCGDRVVRARVEIIILDVEVWWVYHDRCHDANARAYRTAQKRGILNSSITLLYLDAIACCSMGMADRGEETDSF